MFIENTQVLVQENFLTEEDLAFLDKVMEDNKEAIDSMTSDGAYQVVHTDMASFVKKLGYRVQNLIMEAYGKDSVDQIYPRNEIQFLKVDGAMGEHDDAEGQNVSHGAVIYLTDTNDYDGGELVYPKIGLTLKPERGSIAIHPREPDYTHSVSKVTRGVRCVLVMFASKNQR